MSYHFNRITEADPPRPQFASRQPRRRDYIVIPPPGPRRLTIEHIQLVAAEHFGIPLIEMTSARRHRAVARPRQVAMVMCKLKTRRSLPEIGRRFGNRDHTTVIHAIRAVAKIRAENPAFDEQVKALEDKL